MKKKVFVGISGGVDSAVTAYLLKEAGFDVTGIFMKNWSGEDYGIENECPWEEDQRISQEVCEYLEIPHKTYNFEKEYRAKVMSNFFEEYERGNTPNPDILCNKFIKFDLFLNKAIADGADMIATGHYSATQEGKLLKAKDENKDQTYFLSQVTKEALLRTLFPLGELTKPEVREIAKKAGLPNANRKDSQGICFVGKIDLQDFLSQNLKPVKGEIVDIDTGKVVGEHEGVWFYTIGQRKGLKIGGAAQAYFICRKDKKTNRLFVCQGHDSPHLYSKTLSVQNFETIDPDLDMTTLSNLEGMIRYRSTPVSIKSVKAVKNQTNSWKLDVEFETAQWAVTPGQSLVIYQNNECLGSGVID